MYHELLNEVMERCIKVVNLDEHGVRGGSLIDVTHGV